MKQPFAIAGSWRDILQKRGVERPSISAERGGSMINGRYHGQVVSLWAENENDAIQGVLAQCDEIDAREGDTTRQAIISIRTSEALKWRIRAAASDARRTMSDWLMLLAEQELERLVRERDDHS